MSGKINAKLEYHNILNAPIVITNPVTESLIPNENSVIDLGTAEKKFRHLYLSDNSLSIGDVKISSAENRKQNVNLNDFVKKDYTKGVDLNNKMTKVPL